MSQKTWRVGDFCFIFEATSDQKNDPDNFKRLFWIIKSIDEDAQEIIVKRFPNLILCIPFSHYMERCSEKDFLKHTADLKSYLKAQVSDFEDKLHKARQAEIQTLATLQEFGIHI